MLVPIRLLSNGSTVNELCLHLMAQSYMHNDLYYFYALLHHNIMIVKYMYPTVMN